MIKIVLGASLGDEGKGSCVSNLIKNNGTTATDLVIRFNGGHQVGHTVNFNGVRHVFSNFGSGTLQGVPTYWSNYCTVHPLGILNEYDVLIKHGTRPHLFIDPLCPVVTPWDIDFNQRLEKSNQHGSVGVGFGATIARNENHVKLFAQDLMFPVVLREKIEQIKKYYGIIEGKTNEEVQFLRDVNDLLGAIGIYITTPTQARFNKFRNVIFEGGQGILLDQDFGFFPHVTRSNTTSKNALELIKRFDIKGTPEIIYVTRAYSTRHGNGPLPFEHIDLKLVNNENETNVYNEYQKSFRTAPLNIDLLRYAITCDRNFSSNCESKMWFTCLDQVVSEKFYILNDKLCHYNNIEEVDKLLSTNIESHYQYEG